MRPPNVSFNKSSLTSKTFISFAIICLIKIGYTRYNEPCKDACEGRGEDYFWCNTVAGSWDYCSPKGDFQFSFIIFPKKKSVFLCAIKSLKKMTIFKTFGATPLTVGTTAVQKVVFVPG